MADLTTKRLSDNLSEPGLDAVSAPAQAKSSPAAVILDANPGEGAAMPHVSRAHRPGPSVKISREHAEHLAFQRLRTNTSTAVSTNVEQKVKLNTRPLPKPGSARVDRLGFRGATILDKFVNALLFVLRAAARFLSRKVLGGGPNKKVVVKSKTSTESQIPSSTNHTAQTTEQSKASKKKYFPQRSL